MNKTISPPSEISDLPVPLERDVFLRTLAKLKCVVESQDSYSDARRLFVDEQLSFSPWQRAVEHQSLASIMRARLKAYSNGSVINV